MLMLFVHCVYQDTDDIPDGFNYLLLVGEWHIHLSSGSYFIVKLFIKIGLNQITY